MSFKGKGVDITSGDEKMGNGLTILQQSPHDRQSQGCGLPASLGISDQPSKWVPSRYNVRAAGEDGSLVLWNTLSGSISVFEPERVPLVKKALKRSGFEAREKGLVKYLTDRGFLVSQGTNEYRQFQMKFGKQQFRSDALELILMPSEDCNFRCHYCYEDFARGTMKPEVRQGIRKLVEERIRKLSYLEVSWFGGEPLYGWPAIEELAPFFKEKVDEYDISYHGHMTTNGYLLTPDTAEKLLRWGVTSYQITVDGAEEDHNKSRPARDGSGTFAQIYSNLVSLSQRDDEFHITVRVNVDQDNHSRVEELLSKLERDIGSDSRYTMSYQNVSKWGGDNDENLNVCGTDDSVRIMRQLVAATKAKGLNLPTLKGINRFGGDVCYAVRPYNYLIGAAGQVMKCTIMLDKDPANVVGQITPEGVLELNDDRMALWTEPSFETDTQCQKCLFLPNCGSGYCPLPKIEGNSERSKCVPQRSNPKGMLMQLVKETKGSDSERLVEVTAGG